MTQITFVEHSGESTTVEVNDGWSLVQAAVTAGIDGIVGECGGSCACATCHCCVDAARLSDVPTPEASELDMLGSVVAVRRPDGRLACQIKASSALDGLVVTLPETQE